LDTVAIDTPAWAATSPIVTRGTERAYPGAENGVDNVIDND
jgi:hypothetical protein